MWRLLLLFALCNLFVAGSEAVEEAVKEQKFLPYTLPQTQEADHHYTLLAESKDYAPGQSAMAMGDADSHVELAQATNKPWRRLAQGYGQQLQPSWHSSSHSMGLLGPLLSLPAMLMIGLNLGALLYTLLGLLGLGQQRFGSAGTAYGAGFDFYRRERQGQGIVGGGKEPVVYF